MKDIEIASCTWEIGDVTPGRRVMLSKDRTHPGECMVTFHKGNPDTWGLVWLDCGIVEVGGRADCATVLAFLNRYKAVPVVGSKLIEIPA